MRAIHAELNQLNAEAVELPKRKLLEQKLYKAVETARKRLEAKPA